MPLFFNHLGIHSILVSNNQFFICIRTFPIAASSPTRLSIFLTIGAVAFAVLSGITGARTDGQT